MVIPANPRTGFAKHESSKFYLTLRCGGIVRQDSPQNKRGRDSAQVYTICLREGGGGHEDSRYSPQPAARVKKTGGLSLSGSPEPLCV